MTTEAQRPDGWYWVKETRWDNMQPEWVPAEWRQAAKAWYSTQFSGIPDSGILEHGPALADPMQEPIGTVESEIASCGGFHAKLAGGPMPKIGTNLYTSPQPAQPVPEIDYQALIRAAFATNKKWAQGTSGCIAVMCGAEWYRSTLTR